MSDQLEQEIERRIEELGYELVELERTGSKARPTLRMRVDRPGSDEKSGITVEDCRRVSRGLEEWLDELPGLSERYTLEVSSPGVERPLTKPRDFARFAGKEIVVKTVRKQADGTKRIEGELVGLDTRDGEEVIRLRMADGSVVDIARANVARAQLVFRWK